MDLKKQIMQARLNKQMTQTQLAQVRCFASHSTTTCTCRLALASKPTYLLPTVAVHLALATSAHNSMLQTSYRGPEPATVQQSWFTRKSVKSILCRLSMRSHM